MNPWIEGQPELDHQEDSLDLSMGEVVEIIREMDSETLYELYRDLLAAKDDIDARLEETRFELSLRAERGQE